MKQLPIQSDYLPVCTMDPHWLKMFNQYDKVTNPVRKFTSVLNGFPLVQKKLTSIKKLLIQCDILTSAYNGSVLVPKYLTSMQKLQIQCTSFPVCTLDFLIVANNSPVCALVWKLAALWVLQVKSEIIHLLKSKYPFQVITCLQIGEPLLFIQTSQTFQVFKHFKIEQIQKVKC